MASYPLKALVLRKTKLGETDVIVTILAADGRQVRAVAKGLRKPGSRFGGRLEPYSVVDLLMHTGRSLEVVSEARTVRAHAALREDLDRMAAASVVVDLLDKIAVEGQVEPRLFDLASTTLDIMDDAAIEALPRLVVAFLVKALAMHGYRPELHSCSACAGELEGATSFSHTSGGALCSSCAAGDPGALMLATGAREWLALLLGSTMSDVAALEVPPGAIRDCFVLMKGFITFHVPARLKALDFYAGMM